MKKKYLSCFQKYLYLLAYNAKDGPDLIPGSLLNVQLYQKLTHIFLQPQNTTSHIDGVLSLHIEVASCSKSRARIQLLWYVSKIIE